MMRPPSQVRPRSKPATAGGAAQSVPARARKEPTPRARQTPRQERPVRPTGSTLGSEDGLSAASSGTAERPTVRPSPSPRRAKDAKEERVRVCVRVRPMSEVEQKEGFSEVVECDLDNPGTIEISRSLPGTAAARTRKKETFSFDTVMPSSAGQAAVYNLIGRPMFERVAEGFNSCVIAFGATGCGKSHTIFGTNQDRGLLPRISEGLFQAAAAAAGKWLVKVSYLELYNEKARDLLKEDPENGKAASLEVREHPKVGIFVEGLTRSVASSAEDVHRLVDFGHKIRVVGSTNMNARSSRSHAIVTLHLQVVDSSSSGQMVRHSQLHAVDLAGSERLFMVGNNSLRRRESVQINKSLLALGQMISKLAKGVEGAHVPYRNSKLTFLLADSLMGNCKTAMIACVSPSSSFQQLTDSTLRFATSVKQIKTKPVQNQEPSGDLAQTLGAEVATLRRRLRQGVYDPSQARELEAQLRSDEYLQDEFNCSYEDVQVKAKAAEGLRRKTLRRLGLSEAVADATADATATAVGRGGAVVQKLSADALLSGCLTWTLAPGEQLRIGSEPDCEIVIDGLGVEAEMCRLQCLDAQQIQVLPGASRSASPDSEEGREFHRRGSLYKRGSALVMVNTSVLKEPQLLRCGDFLRVGRSHFFRIAPLDGETVLSSAAPAQDVKEAMETALGINGFTKDAQQLRQRFGVQKADEVIKDLKDLKLIVEEANELTAELRGNDDLSFKGRVLMDPLDNEEEPSVVVSLKISRPETGETLNGDRYAERSHAAIATWTLPEFQQRLEVMRDIYDEVRLRDLPWGQPGDLDPWHARDNIPVITSTTPRSSYAGSPLARQSGHTPEAISPEPCQSTTLLVPIPSGENAEADSKPGSPRSLGRQPPGRMAMILQQLPLLQAELAKAHETQGQQAHELHSVRKELEELRQSMSVSKMSTSALPRAGSPARRPSDAGNVTPPSEACAARHLGAAPLIPEAKLRAKLTPPRWQGARTLSPDAATAPGNTSPRTVSPSHSQVLGSPMSAKEDLALSNLSGISSVPQASDRSTQLSMKSFKVDGISCYAPARSLAESAGCVPFQPQLPLQQPLQSTISLDGSAIRRQFSAPVARRSHVVRQSLSGTTQLRPVSTVLPVQPALTPRSAVAPTVMPCIGWPAPTTGGSMVLAPPLTPRVATTMAAPQVVSGYVTPTPRKVQPPLVAPAVMRSSSPSPMENAMKVASRHVAVRRANPAASTQAQEPPGPGATDWDRPSPATPRWRNAAEPVTAESLNAMTAAAKAAAQAAPGMNILVRPVSTAQMALLNQDLRLAASAGDLPEDGASNSTRYLSEVDVARGEQLRSCQVELAGLRKEVDALGQVCRGLTQAGVASVANGVPHAVSPRFR